MKLIGSKKKGKHVKNGRGAKDIDSTSEPKKSGKKGKKKLHVGLRILIGVVVVITALALGAVAYYTTMVKAPPQKNYTPITPRPDTDEGNEVPVATDDPERPVTESNGIRDDKKYTFLILGSDDGNGNTDVIMVATLDTRDYTLNVVSIPRDTLINASWSPKKANTIYSVMKKKGTEEDELAGVRDKFAELLGYHVDYYAVVDLDAFVKLVDGIGGVYFDVPRNMNYSDPAQNLYINISKGPQTLDGKKSLQLVRFRSGYASADIGRIDMTQQFLTAAVKQILENKSSLKITTLADIFLNNVKTDMNLNEIIWFGKEAFKLDADKVSFTTLPGNYNDTLGGGSSYVTIYVNEWLEIINDKLNPFTVDITLDNLSIYTRNSNGSLYVTNGGSVGGSGGSSSSSSGGSSSGSSGNSGSSGGTGTPKPTETPKPTPTPTPTPTPDSGTETSPDIVTETPDITDPAVTDPVITDNPDTTPTPPPADEPTSDPITPPPATPPDDNSLFYTGDI